MKNLVLILAVMLLNVAAFANTTNNPTNDKSRVFIKANETTSVTLRLINLENKYANISLIDASDNILFSKKVRNSAGYAMKLDFSRLTSGEYTLRINREEKTYTQTLSVNGLGFVAIEEMIEYEKPTITQFTDNFVIANPSNDITSVSIYNKKGEILYKKEYGAEEKTAENVKYDLSKVNRGDYQVKVSTTNSAHYFDVFVK